MWKKVSLNLMDYCYILQNTISSSGIFWWLSEWQKYYSGIILEDIDLYKFLFFPCTSLFLSGILILVFGSKQTKDLKINCSFWSKTQPGNKSMEYTKSFAYFKNKINNDDIFGFSCSYIIVRPQIFTTDKVKSLHKIYYLSLWGKEDDTSRKITIAQMML